MPRPKTYDDDLRERLIARAAHEIARRGPEGLSLRPVAAAVGTSTTAVYSMFGGRPGLVAAVSRAAADGFVEAQRAVPTTSDAFADLLDLGRAYRAWALENPSLYTVLMSPIDPALCLDGPLPQSASAAPLRELIVRLIEEGVFLDLVPDLILGAIWASVHGFVALELADLFRPATREQCDAMYEELMASMGRGWRVAGV